MAKESIEERVERAQNTTSLEELEKLAKDEDAGHLFPYLRAEN